MKKKSIIGLFVSLLGLGMTTTSCEDMLTPDMDLYTEGFSGRDTVNFYYGILSNVQDMIENNVLLGELRSDLVDTTSYVSDTVARVSNFEKVADGDNGLLKRAAYYNVINQCNFYLAKADTMAQKNNKYYMRREFAQVQMVRAWTYMQLVQNYGEVPFITKPVDNANTGWEKNPEEGYINLDNLLEKLVGAGLQRAYNYANDPEIGTPVYTAVSNGALSISPTYFVFQPDLIMGDLYLMRGNNTSDYETAAQYYYNFIERSAEKSKLMPTMGKSVGLQSHMADGRRVYEWSSASGWADFCDQGTSVGTEIVTCVASSAASNFGTMLTRAAQIYGFDANSSTSSSMSKDDNGNDVESASGKITVTANYKNRQVTASRRYLNLSSSQIAITSTGMGDTKTNEYVAIGDGRINGSISKVNTAVGDLTFIKKRAFSSNRYTGTTSASTSSFSFNYTFPVYRMRQIYLRFAEAINRAGYPRYAYAILRDGLSSLTIPSIMTDSVAQDAEGKYRITPYASRVSDGANYIDINELRRASNAPYLDFDSENYFDNVVGIHELGTGETNDKDTLSLYDVVVGKRMAEEAARNSGLNATPAAVKRYVSMLQSEDQPTTGGEGSDDNTGDSDEPGSSADNPLPALAPTIPENIGEQVNAVETLICDEMALETAFEGYRFYDLARIARHKNNDNWAFTTSNYGTNWFAWTIARRSVNLAPYEQPTQFNGALYTKLQNQNNWYLQNPQY